MGRALLARLLAYHPEAGFACLPVGVLGIWGGEALFELVAAPEAEGWELRLASAGRLDEGTIRGWGQASGIGWGIELSEAPFQATPGGLRALVASAFEALLVDRATLKEELP